MQDDNVMAEDWELLVSLFPKNWQELAQETDALKGLRQDKSPDHLIRTLLIHLGCGYSLRETVVRARRAQLADLSDVALLKRLRKSQAWLQELCRGLFEERSLDMKSPSRWTMRLIDATTVKEPGKTGSLWRIHYSLRWPALVCDFFKLTGSEGQGTGESLTHFPVQQGDYLLADRGYSNAASIHYVAAQGGYLTVRANPQGLRIWDQGSRSFPLLERLRTLKKPATIRLWKVWIPNSNGDQGVSGRLCVIRKGEAAIALAHKKLREKARKHGTTLQPETLIYAEYVIVFSTFPEEHFSAQEILEWYRVRWQVELVFKRFKQIADLGHLPKYDDVSAKAWLYGKLFVALLTEKLISQAVSFSPWGYHLERLSHAQPVA